MTAHFLFWTLRPWRMRTSCRTRRVLTYIGSGRMWTAIGSRWMLTDIWSGRMLTCIGRGRMLTCIGCGRMLTCIWSWRMLTHIRCSGMLTGIWPPWMSTACIGHSWPWAGIRDWWMWASSWSTCIRTRTPWPIIRSRATLRPCTRWPYICNLQETVMEIAGLWLRTLTLTKSEVKYMFLTLLWLCTIYWWTWWIFSIIIWSSWCSFCAIVTVTAWITRSSSRCRGRAMVACRTNATATAMAWPSTTTFRIWCRISSYE
jgi:hypothetical protein